MANVLIPVVLCGGSGSRLWPVSREQHPKPFIRMADGETLLQKAFLRGAGLPDVAEILTVTNRELSFRITDDFRDICKEELPVTYILEPEGRNTAAAVAVAALQASRRYGEDALLLVLSADHLIADREAFFDAVAEAKILAENGKLVTFGIPPSAPETGYGYIEAEGSHVLRFVEKPPLEKAKEYVASGRFLWNAGIFCFRAGVVLDEMRTHCSEVLAAVETCLTSSHLLQGDGVSQLDLDKDSFAKTPSVSFDYAVMEKSSRVAVVPCDIGWSDVGSWSAFEQMGETDGLGNCVEGEATLHDVRNCYIRSHRRMVGAVGVEDLVIVDTEDALLVAKKSRAQEVKSIYNELKLRGHEAYRQHRTVHRPWGTYTVLEEGDQFKIKRVVVKPGGRLSLQMHHHRSEHWVVVSGMALVVNGESQMSLGVNESTYIPAGHKHRLENPGTIDLVIIEVQSGDYLGEDDIVRFEDNYGRC